MKLADNVATFAWEDNSDESHANIDDFAMPLIYNFTKGEAIFTTEDASRVDCQATLKLPSDWQGDQLSCYIAFASVQNNSVSNSVYVGDLKTDGKVEQEGGSSSSETTPTTPSGGTSSGGTTSGGDSGNDGAVGVE